MALRGLGHPTSQLEAARRAPPVETSRQLRRSPLWNPPIHQRPGCPPRPLYRPRPFPAHRYPSTTRAHAATSPNPSACTAASTRTGAPAAAARPAGAAPRPASPAASRAVAVYKVTAGASREIEDGRACSGHEDRAHARCLHDSPPEVFTITSVIVPSWSRLSSFTCPSPEFDRHVILGFC